MVWSCSACTYENVDADRDCSMCGTPRPGSERPLPEPAVVARSLAPPPQPQHREVLTTIPANVRPGMKFHVAVFNQLFEVQVPPGYGPGMQLQVSVPV